MMMNFLALGAPVALIIWGLQAQKLGRSLRSVLTVVGLFLLVGVAFYLSRPTFLSGEAWYERSPWKESLLLITMLVGMAARSLDEAIELRRRWITELEKKGALEEKPKLSLDPWDFSRPFLVSLPTFGVLLSQVGQQSLDWIIMALAFQTGFFWQTILKKR